MDRLQTSCTERRILTLYARHYTPSMLENEMEKNMETEMEAGNIYGLVQITAQGTNASTSKEDFQVLPTSRATPP